jgi:hypothetical protein
MWNPDDNEKKKNLLSKEVLATPIPIRVEALEEYEVFKFNFINSVAVRKAHGFEKRRDGKLYLVDRKWVDSTVDEEKKEWVRRIYKEVNGIQGESNVGEKEQV